MRHLERLMEDWPEANWNRIPMEQGDPFEREYVARTVELLEQYRGPCETALAVNSLLGLLVLLREPSDFLSSFYDHPLGLWGIADEAVKDWGECPPPPRGAVRLNQRHIHVGSGVAHLVYRMRNAARRDLVSAVPGDGRIAAYAFEDTNGFRAELTTEDIRGLVINLGKRFFNWSRRNPGSRPPRLPRRKLRPAPAEAVVDKWPDADLPAPGGLKRYACDP